MTTTDHALVLSCIPIARRIAAFYCKKHSTDILDLRQEAMIGVCHALKEWNPARGKFATIAYYRASEYARNAVLRDRLIRVPRSWKHSTLQTYEIQYDIAIDNQKVYEIASDRELCSRLMAALSPLDQEIIRLRFWEGKGYRQIGELTGYSESGAMFRVRSALAKMRKAAERR